MNVFKNTKLKERYFGYIEGIIYALLILIVIFTSIAGPLLLKMFPIVYLLGIIARIIYDRPFITSVFGFLVSICLTYMLGIYSFSYIITYSLFCFISILTGEITAKYILKTKQNKTNKNILTLVLLITTGLALNSYTNGNYTSYFKSRQVVLDYINLNYSGSENVRITGGKYNFNKYNWYTFQIKNIDEDDALTYSFTVYLNNEIIDGYKESRIALNNRKLKDKFFYKINLEDYTKANFKIDIKYSDLKDNITLFILKRVDKITEENLHIFAKDVNNILKTISNFDEFPKINKLNIAIKYMDNEFYADIYNTNFFNTKYYIESLQIEYLDE